jgi:hypothetical protein
MIELDFWDERRGITIARASAHDPAAIPASGDGVYIPDAEQSGAYLHLKVTARQFYYSQEGDLVSIRLLCEVI